MKLLQVPSIDMHAHVEREMLENPALESDTSLADEPTASGEISLDIQDPWYSGRRAVKRSYLPEGRQDPAASASLHEHLVQQLHFLKLNRRQHRICMHLIGCIEQDGYIRRNLDAIAEDLIYTESLQTSAAEIETLLKKIQRCEPVGIGSRNLQECLLVQLHVKGEPNALRKKLAANILTHCFEAFVNKHYDKIARKLHIDCMQALRNALDLILTLNPKPTRALYGYGHERNEWLHPDFVVEKEADSLHVQLSRYRLPTLRLSKYYTTLLERHQQGKEATSPETVSFLQRRLERARWFLLAIEQRQQTLLRTMQAIVKLQRSFFLDEQERNLKPMVLRSIAEEIKMDVSTVSRIVSNKVVETRGGIYPLRFFFSEGISTSTGGDVSNKEVQSTLAKAIKHEDAAHPYTDEQLAALLCKSGYNIARRTVAKYRQHLGLPTARLRRKL